jgi:hypothetical protein
VAVRVLFLPANGWSLTVFVAGKPRRPFLYQVCRVGQSISIYTVSEVRSESIITALHTYLDTNLLGDQRHVKVVIGAIRHVGRDGDNSRDEVDFVQAF